MKNRFAFLLIFSFFVLGHIGAMGQNPDEGLSILPLKKDQITENQAKLNFKKLFTKKCNDDQSQIDDILAHVKKEIGREIDEESLSDILYDLYSKDEDYKDLGDEGFIGYILNDQVTLVDLIKVYRKNILSQEADKTNFVNYFLEKCNNYSSIDMTIKAISGLTGQNFTKTTFAEFLYPMCSTTPEYESFGYKKAIDDMFGSYNSFFANVLGLVSGQNNSTQSNSKGCVVS